MNVLHATGAARPAQCKHHVAAQTAATTVTATDSFPRVRLVSVLGQESRRHVEDEGHVDQQVRLLTNAVALQRPTAPKLTRRERQVLDGLANCLVPKQVAYELNLSVKTVLRHRLEVARKLGVRSDISIYLASIALKLVSPDLSADRVDRFEQPGPTRRAPYGGKRSTAGFTARELQVLSRLVGGRVVKEIAHELNLSRQTVSKYRADLALKLGARSDVSVYIAALKRGLL